MSHYASSTRGPIPITASPSRPMMDPTPPLERLHTKLTTLISTSHTLCSTIRHSRRLSPTGTASTALSALESALATSLPHLATQYAALRAPHPAAFARGDPDARAALQAVVNALAAGVERRLADVAEHRAGSRDKSGFRDILALFSRCLHDACRALQGLAERVAAAHAPPARLPAAPVRVPAPAPIPGPAVVETEGPRARRREREREAPRLLEADEVAIGFRQFEMMDAMVRNCWEEVAAGGGRKFRNCADPGWVVYGVVPEGGFVRELPRGEGW